MKSRNIRSAQTGRRRLRLRKKKLSCSYFSYESEVEAKRARRAKKQKRIFCPFLPSLPFLLLSFAPFKAGKRFNSSSPSLSRSRPHFTAVPSRLHLTLVSLLVSPSAR